MNLRSVILNVITLSAGDDQATIITPRVMKAIRALLDEKAQGLEQEVMNILKDHGLREFTTPGVGMAVDLVTLVEFMQAEGHLEMEIHILQLKTQLKTLEGRVDQLKGERAITRTKVAVAADKKGKEVRAKFKELEEEIVRLKGWDNADSTPLKDIQETKTVMERNMLRENLKAAERVVKMPKADTTELKVVAEALKEKGALVIDYRKAARMGPFNRRINYESPDLGTLEITDVGASASRSLVESYGIEALKEEYDLDSITVVD